MLMHYICVKATQSLYRDGIVGRISPKTWAAMEVFLQSIAIEDYESMASVLIDMGATGKDVDSKAFASDLEKIFLSIERKVELRKEYYKQNKEEKSNARGIQE